MPPPDAMVERVGSLPLAAKERLELGWLIGLIVSEGRILSFGWIAEEVLEGDTKAFDRRVLLLFRHADDPSRLLGPAWVTETLRDLTGLGSTVVLGLVVVLVLGYLGMSHRWAAFRLILVSVLGGQLITTALKLLVERPRPDLVPNAPAVFTASFRAVTPCCPPSRT